MATGLMVVRRWSVMLARSGENAENVPVCAAVVTALQPQPPGTQVATAEANAPRVPLSKPSLSGLGGLGDEAVADSLVGLPGGSVVRGEPPVVFIVGAIGGVATVVPGGHHAAVGQRRDRGLPLGLGGGVGVELERG